MANPTTNRLLDRTSTLFIEPLSVSALSSSVVALLSVASVGVGGRWMPELDDSELVVVEVDVAVEELRVVVLVDEEIVDDGPTPSLAKGAITHSFIRSLSS
jgi:hypothetical protein